MNSNRIKSMALAATAALCLAIPAFGSAQRQGQERWPIQNNRIQNFRSLEQMVKRAERESNEFRENFEHNYRGRSRPTNWDNGRGNGRNNNGRWGNGQNQYGWWGMDLKSDIQKMDEAFERLRKIVDKNDRNDWNDGRNNNWRGGLWHTRDGRKEMETVVRYSNEIDRELGRGFGNYERGRRSLTEDWRELKRDIDSLAREFGVRS